MKVPKNLPNVLSALRLLMVPILPIVYFSDQIPWAPQFERPHIAAMIVFGLAYLTDALDGWLARKFDLITKLGRLLDPLADKCMSFCALICIIVKHQEPLLIWAGIAFFAKEAVQGIGVLVLFRKIRDIPGSNLMGKIATIFFFAVCFLIFCFDIYLPPPILIGALTIAVLLNIAAFVMYAALFVSHIRKK